MEWQNKQYFKKTVPKKYNSMIWRNIIFQTFLKYKFLYSLKENKIKEGFLHMLVMLHSFKQRKQCCWYITYV